MMKDGTRVLLALGTAIGLGALISASGNEQAVHVADMVAPIGALWVTAIRMTVIPLLTALIVTGVASAVDVRDLGRLGVRSLLTFVALLVGAAIVASLVGPMLFALLPEGLQPALPAGAADATRELTAGAQSQTFASWVTSLLPSNPVGAAASNAMVPYVLFVLTFAVAVARSPAESRATLLTFFRALGDAMMTLVRGVIWLAPIGIFATVLPIASHAGASLVGAIGLYIFAYSALSILAIALTYPVVAVAGGVSMQRFARAALPAQLIAFSSSSSLAALPAAITAAEEDLAISKRVTGFVMPLAGAMFKLAAPTSWIAGTLFVSWFYHIPLSVAQIALVAVSSVFLGFASPGIPRGSFLMLAPILLSVGLPVDGVGILIAVDAIPDTFATVLNVTGNLTATVLVANASAEPR